MEEEAGSPPFPLLALHRGKKLTLHSPSPSQEPKSITIPHKLHHKQIKRACSNGWLIFSDEKDRYSLWNPMTDISIHLPALSLKPHEEICNCILSSPPGSPDSMLILFETKTPSFIFCGIGDNKKWKKQQIDDYFRKFYMDEINSVICNGRLFLIDTLCRELVAFDIMPDHLALSLSPLLVPRLHICWPRTVLVESLGELFLINLAHKGIRRSWEHLTAVEVFRLDLSEKEWCFESFKDRAFFVSKSVIGDTFSYPAIGEVEGNRVYYESRYSYNMEDRTTSLSLPYSNLRESLYQDTAFYLMPDPDNRVGNYVDRHIKNNLNDGSKKEIKPEIGEIVNDTANIQEEDGAGDEFCKLSLDLLSAIARWLLVDCLHGYMSFRAANRMCRLAAPPVQSLEVSLSPWLTFWEKADSTAKFFDPIRGEKYLMNIPNNQFEDVELYYTGEGWCVMLQNDQSIFLWNPFAKKIIPLPNIPHDRSTVSGCGFSASPDSSDCVIALLNDVVTKCYIDLISLKDKEWRSVYIFDRQASDLEMAFDRNLAFHNGDFYFLDMCGKLVAFRMKEEEFYLETLDKPECPTDSFHQNYLLNCDGKLLSVFVAFFGKWVRIFSLDDSEMAWVEVENLGNHTLYVNHLSAFSTCATPEMENRVYFPHYYGQSAVYYSLDSRKFHSQGSGHVLKDLSVTREQLLCAWVEPKF